MLSTLKGGIRARAPLRLGLAGGGTDLSPFCDEYGGSVMNATLSLYAYVHMSPNHEGRLVFESAEQGQRFETDAASNVPLDPGTILHCGVYNRIIREFNGNRPLPLTIRTTVDVPAGSGMGGSSTLVVALVEAFRHYLGLPLGEYDIARLAFEIEREELKISGGKQDQYAAAFGGFNFMEFYSGGQTVINPLRIKPNIIQELEASLILYYTGRSRSSAFVIEAQQDQLNTGNKGSLDAMLSLKEEALQMKEALLKGRLDHVAETMARGWEAKKLTASAVSNSEIDRILDLALENGGLAGKVSGAGGGGFVAIIAKPSERYRVINALRQEPGQLLPVVFTSEGACSWRQVL